MITRCKRCGKQYQVGIGNPEARLLKRSAKGYCADCAFTEFIKTTEPLYWIIEHQGVEVLRDKQIRLEMAKLLIVGKSDASINEIDMDRVITNWNLPIHTKRRWL